MKKFLFLLLTVVTFFSLYCNYSLTGNGGSSGTVNAKLIITDTLLNLSVEEQPGDRLSLYMYSTQYRPYEKSGFRDSIECTNSLSLCWKAPHEGSYNVLISSDKSQYTCFLQSLNLSRGTDTVISCTLQTPVNISGNLLSEKSVTDTAYLISLNGTPFYSIADKNNSFTLKNIPRGAFSLRVSSLEKRLFSKFNEYNLITDSIGNNSQLKLYLP